MFFKPNDNKPSTSSELVAPGELAVPTVQHRQQGGDVVRVKLAESGIVPRDVGDAMAWVRREPNSR
jgi:hypothetical protein